MPPVLGPQVAVERALVILSSGHAMSLASRNKCEKRALGAGQALLDDNGGTGLAESAGEALADSIFCSLFAVGDDDALASSKTVGLDDDGRHPLRERTPGQIPRR